MMENQSGNPIAHDATPYRSGKRHSTRRHSSKSQVEPQLSSRKLWLPVALAISLFLLLSVTIFSIISITGYAQENEALQAELSKARQTLKQTEPELEQARKTLAQITKGRLPHLQDMIPDQVLNINGPYIKNVVFTVLNQNDTDIYEFKMVMENATTRNIRPKSRIIVFDRNGVQIGGAEIADLTELAPGESRSQSAVIDRFIDAEPRYFYVSTLPSVQVAKLQH